jgi:transcriptional regulator with XRE-family HTH domain
MDVRLTQFGQRLQELRAAAGLTQKQLARKARVPLSTVGLLEKGSAEPLWYDVLALSEAMNVPCSEFSPDTEKPAKAMPVTPPADQLEAVEKQPARKRKRKRSLGR